MLSGAKAGLDVGIVARDIDAMLEFYVETLGLDYVESLAIPWGMMHRLRFEASWLKLVAPTVPVASGPSGLDAAAGLRYVTFEVIDIDAPWARLMTAGAEVFHDLGPFGRHGVTMGMVFDPDGNVVELLRRTSVLLPAPTPTA